MVDKRLAIELARLRQDVWRAKGQTIGDARMQEYLPAEPTDQVQRVDTSTMLADGLTKRLRDDPLLAFMELGRHSFQQSEAARQLKGQRAVQRKNAKVQAGENKEKVTDEKAGDQVDIADQADITGGENGMGQVDNVDQASSTG